MSTDEAKLLIPLLTMLKQHLSHQVCNDWEIPNTVAGRSLLLKFNQWNDPDDNDEWSLDDLYGPVLNIPDFCLIDYLIHCIESNIQIGDSNNAQT